MNRIKILLITSLISFFNLYLADISKGCYAVVVGKKASYDGSVLLAHAEQNGPQAFLNFRVVPRLKYPTNSYVVLNNGGKYANVAETYSFLWSENFGMPGSDAVMNEFGVSCVSDATHTIETTDDFTNGGVTIEIRIEIAKRAKTARQGLHIAADMLKKFGYPSAGGTLIIADPNEAWLLTIVRGRHWIAQRVPDDKVVVLPNVNIIGEINLKDTLNFFGSPDIIEYAIKKGWYNPNSGQAFNFKKAYDLKPTHAFELKYGCDPRQWRGQCFISGLKIELPVKENLPFAIKANRKITVKDLRQLLSDHLEGTEFDMSNSYNKGTPHKLMDPFDGMVCNADLQEISIFQLRNWLPAEIGCIQWRTTAAPCSSVLTPWYSGITTTPLAYYIPYDITENIKYSFHFSPAFGTYDYNPDKAFWVYNSLENLVDMDYSQNIKVVKAVWSELENKEFDLQSEIDQTAVNLYKKDKSLAKSFLTTYCNGTALDALEKAKNLEKELRTKMYGY